MIDIHAHFAEEGYEFPAEWEKIRAAGVHTVILAADNLPHAKMHAQFAREHEGAYFTVGVHPSEAESFPSSLFELSSLAAEEKCVAVGEIGLDYHYPEPDRALQREVFSRQLRLAKELSLPVEIHSRDACADTLALLTEARDCLKAGFVMHCYSYGAENLEKFLSLGAYFSFGGVVCFKNAKNVVKSAVACPIERLLTETDSPYLSPFRGEKNTPANIPVILRELARIKNLPEEELRETVRRNARALFSKL